MKQEGEDKGEESSPEPPEAPSKRKPRGPRAAEKAKKVPSRTKKTVAKDKTAETQAGDAGTRRRSLRLKK